MVNIHATTQLKVVLVSPQHFEDASEIADQLKSKRTVVMNLEATNKDVARRLVDFPLRRGLCRRRQDQARGQQHLYHHPYHVDIEGDLINELENNGLYFKERRTKYIC